MRESKVYTLLFKKSVLKDLRNLPLAVIELLRREIDKLKQNPFPPTAKKLQGYKSIYRLRVADYRIIYEVGKEVRIITVIKIGHRKSVYRRV